MKIGLFLSVVAVVIMFSCNNGSTGPSVVKYDTTRYHALYVDDAPFKVLRGDWVYRLDITDFIFTDTTRQKREYKSISQWYVPVYDTLNKPVHHPQTNDLLWKPIHEDSIIGFVNKDIDSLQQVVKKYRQ